MKVIKIIKPIENYAIEDLIYIDDETANEYIASGIGQENVQEETIINAEIIAEQVTPVIEPVINTIV